MEFQSKYQRIICDIFDPAEVLKATEELDDERRLMDASQAKELSDFDKDVIHKLDDHQKDQQSTLERAGVPGMQQTDDIISIKVQIHLLKCILHIGKH